MYLSIKSILDELYWTVKHISQEEDSSAYLNEQTVLCTDAEDSKESNPPKKRRQMQ
jgi:hypothetical protein